MRLKYILVVLLQVLILFGIIAYRQYWVATGDRVLLKTAPVDPRDIFRGDYVNLGFEISTLDLEGLGVKESFGPNEKVYVVLEKIQDGTCKAVSASKTPPGEKGFIQGRVQHEMVTSRWEVDVMDDAGELHHLKPQWFQNVKRGERVTFCLDERGNIINFFKEDSGYKPRCGGRSISGVVEEMKESRTRTLRVEYGIESYFVEEGKGREIESGRGSKEMRVEVSLRKDGKGIITGLYVEGNWLR